LRRALGAGLATLFALLSTGLLVAGAGGTGTIPVSIVSSANPADAALPFELVAKAVSAEVPVFYNWTDSLGGSNDASTWDLDVEVPGNLTVTLDVSDASGDRGEATLTILVRPSPSVTVSSPLTQVDAGVPAPFFIDVVGGVPPLRANWTPSGGGPDGNASWPTDGNYSEEVNFSEPGSGWILVRIVDALGDPATADELVTEVVGPGSITLATNGSIGEVGWPLELAVDVDQGAPPFRWSIASSLPITDNAEPLGVFPSDGMYRWNISFDISGVAVLNLTSIDAVGTFLTATTDVAVESPLSVHVTSPSLETATPFEVSANVSGGFAPYAYQFRLSDGEGSNGTLTSAGLVSTTFGPPPDGNYSVEVRVTDDLGRTSITTEFFRVGESTAPATDPPDSDLSICGGIVVLTVIALLATLYAYRRFVRTPAARTSPENSALPTVRQLMKQSQIIDRETLLLLCEEAGESPDAAQTALQVLIRTGEVSTEPGPPNDEVLRWKGTGPRETSGEDPP